MQPCRQLKGVIPVVQTPVRQDGEVDVEGLNRLIDFLLSKDVGGFWALGTGSEDMNLSFDKRLTVARTIAAANAGRKPLIMGSGFFAMDDITAFMAATKDLQFDAYHVMPYHPLLGLDGMEKFYRDLAARAPKPLWMYTSANWCRAFPPDFVARLKACPNIAGIKYSTSRTTDQINVIAMAEPEFQVITAVATQFFVVLSLGVAASTTSLAGALPEPLIEIYTLYQAGRRDEALAAQHRLNGFLRRLPSRPKAWNFLGAAEEKYILSLRCICEPYVTSYYTALTEEERSQVRAALEESGYAALLRTPAESVGAA
jgi:4-hydroxy-tetrahydrodipicolinate synthase